MSSVSRPVSGQTPMRGMIEEQSVQSASVKGSVSSSESVIDASIMSSVSIVKGGSESSGMSELVDRMLKYQPPPNLTAEMGETVDDVIKYMKSTAELLSDEESSGYHLRSFLPLLGSWESLQERFLHEFAPLFPLGDRALVDL